MNLDPEERMAFCIIFGRMKGSHDFDWDTQQWRKRDA